MLHVHPIPKINVFVFYSAITIFPTRTDGSFRSSLGLRKSTLRKRNGNTLKLATTTPIHKSHSTFTLSTQVTGHQWWTRHTKQESRTNKTRPVLYYHTIRRCVGLTRGVYGLSILNTGKVDMKVLHNSRVLRVVWAPKPVWTSLWKGTIPTPERNRTPVAPAHVQSLPETEPSRPFERRLHAAATRGRNTWLPAKHIVPC